MKLYDNPEVVAQVRTVDAEGEDHTVGDRVTGVKVLFDDDAHREGTVQIDVRDFDQKKQTSLILEMPLTDLMAAAHGYSEHLHAAVGLFEKLGPRVRGWAIHRCPDGPCVVDLVSQRGVAYTERGESIPRLIAQGVTRLLTDLKAA